MRQFECKEEKLTYQNYFCSNVKLKAQALSWTTSSEMSLAPSSRCTLIPISINQNMIVSGQTIQNYYEKERLYKTTL